MHRVGDIRYFLQKGRWIDSFCFQMFMTARNWQATKNSPFEPVITIMWYDGKCIWTNCSWANTVLGFVVKFRSTGIWDVRQIAVNETATSWQSLALYISRGHRVLSSARIHDYQRQFWSLPVNYKIVSHLSHRTAMVIFGITIWGWFPYDYSVVPKEPTNTRGSR